MNGSSNNAIEQISLLIVQFKGNYASAFDNILSEGQETYYAQRYSIEECGKLAKKIGKVGVLACVDDEKGNRTLPNGVVSISTGLDHLSANQVIDHIRNFNPSHVILTTPNPYILGYLIKEKIKVFPLFADSFHYSNKHKNVFLNYLGRWRQWFRNKRLFQLLKSDAIYWMGNHNRNASRQLASFGISPEQIIPYDWPPVCRAEDNAPKNISTRCKLLFIGAFIESKGYLDAIACAGELRDRGVDFELGLIGKGNQKPLIDLINKRNLGSFVTILGPRTNKEVIQALNRADILLVPSHHVYPEGLPLTIYESMATRTPFITSDHPMFIGQVGTGLCSLMVKERKPVELADAVIKLINDPNLYHSMSLATLDVLNKMRATAMLYDIINSWLEDPSAQNPFLQSNSLVHV